MQGKYFIINGAVYSYPSVKYDGSQLYSLQSPEVQHILNPERSVDDLFSEELYILNEKYESESGELVKRHAQAVARDGSTETEKVTEIRAEISALDIKYESDQSALIDKYYGD